MLRSAAKVVRAGGHAFITLDLKQNTQSIWNSDRGEKVEDEAIHESLKDFIANAESQGWTLRNCSVIRQIAGAKQEVELFVRHGSHHRLRRTPA